MYELLGDDRAQRLIARCLRLLCDATEQSNGKVVKTIGDEVMCTFANTDAAAAAAARMQRRLEGFQTGDDELVDGPKIHIGIHTGPLIRLKDDVYGDTVNLAARVVSLAKPRQILITEEALEALSAANRSSARYVVTETIRGRTGEVKIYEYLWDMSSATVMLEKNTNSPGKNHCLELSVGGRIFRVDRNMPIVTMGRQNHNDIVLKYERISRSHASIQFKRGKFVLTDHSSNGTYLHMPGETGLYINRDEALLFGSGLISLGRRASPGSPGAIHFTVIG